MRKKLPTTVNIGGLVFKIKYVIPGAGSSLEKGDAGCVTQDKQEICIDKKLPYPLKMTILLHEFLHAIGDTFCPNKNAFIKEEFTCVVSSLLFQALTSAKLLK